MKKAALQVLLNEAQTDRVDKCAKKIKVTSRAEFAERSLDFIMPLIETGQIVNLNGKLIRKDDVAKELASAA
ncbi:MAG: hypothetical protein P4L99_27910 [Chthoniobacter sp.]|nr:hypothetical protein [Chthoniobacter sp.]